MANFFIGLCVSLLGFGIYQFSHLFGLYRAQNDKGVPWPYMVLLTISISLILAGIALMAIGLS
jgi:hypothetical protein